MSDQEVKESTLEASENVLELSDEQFMDMDYPSYSEPQTEPEDVTEEPETEEGESDNESDDDEDDNEPDQSDDTDDGDTDSSDEDKYEDTEENGDEPSEVNSDEELKKLFTPFKANGKEIKVDSVDEAITLMQMGANYNKKMAALKPNLKILKTLENNGLLEQGKLDYLIDLDKKNPEAIKKLLQDSGIDPLDIDTNSEVEYKPKTYTVDDKEIELDAVLEEIQDTPTYSKTIDIIGNKWDGESREIMVNNPSIIKAINEHMGNGVFEQVTSLMEKERVMGRLSNMSDLEAYKYIGDQLFANQAQQPITQKPEPIIKRPVSNKPDPKLTSRKKAASPTKSSPAVNKQTEYNPLSMSDEEFEKVINSKFL